MKEETIKVVVVYPDEPVPYEGAIHNSLTSMQKLVGGYIELFRHDGMEIICNEEGKLEGLPLNRPIFNKDGEVVEILAGTFFVAAADSEGNWRSLTEDEIKKALDYFTMTKEKAERFAVALRKMGIAVDIIEG